MGLPVAEDGTAVSGSIPMDVPFQDLDVERLFVDQNEMAVMKTLQTMHLANFQLEDKIKGVMTDDIEPILLYSGNMLGMCSLVKETSASLKELTTLCNQLNATPNHTGKESNQNANEEEELLQFMKHCASQYQMHGAIGGLLEGEKRFDHIDVLLKSIQMLRRLSMDNFRLLKRNKLLMSYRLLRVQSPALMSLMKHITQKGIYVTENKRIISSNDPLDAESCNGKAYEHVQDAEIGRRNKLSKAREEHFHDFLIETQSALEYNITKLVHHCEEALSSSNLHSLTEASICLLLENDKGNNNEYASVLWKTRLKRTKIEYSSMVLGCLGSCKRALSQLITSAMFQTFCKHMNTEILYNLENILGISSSDIAKEATATGNDETILFNKQDYWVSTMDLMSRHFERVEMSDMVDFYESCKSLVTSAPKELKGNELLNKVYMQIGMDIDKALEGVSMSILSQLDSIYYEGALSVAMVAIDNIKRRLMAREICVSSIKSLSNFLEKAEKQIEKEINGSMAAVLKELLASIEGVEAPVQASGIFNTYGKEGTVQSWLSQSNLTNVIISVESLWPAMQMDAMPILELIARKCVVPPTGNDSLVKTLIGTGTLGSEYFLLGANIFPRCLKKACLEYLLVLCNQLSTREKAILILSIKDSEADKDLHYLAERLKDNKGLLSSVNLEEHKAEYEGLKNFI